MTLRLFASSVLLVQCFRACSALLVQTVLISSSVKNKKLSKTLSGTVCKGSTNTQAVLKMSMCIFFTNKFICDFLQFF